MKQLLSFFAVLFVSVAVYAQSPFMVYKPFMSDRNGNRTDMSNGSKSNNYNNYYNYKSPQRSNSYGNNYYNYNPYYNSSSQQSQQKMSQLISTRGYYIKNNQWWSVPLRVKIIDERVYVIGIKRQSTGWANETIKASSTDFMQKEIRDNFDYYIRDYGYGVIYF